MAFVEKTYESMLDEIEFQRFIRYDIISPEKNPELFVKEASSDLTFVPSKKYKEEILKDIELSEKSCSLISVIIEEVMTNMHKWAHNHDKSLEMSLKVAEGERGYVLRFKDSGKGFDYRNVLKKLKNYGEYSHRFGWGLATIEVFDVEAAYEGNGSILNVKIRRKKDENNKTTSNRY